ncbi:MAG: nitronate monooxygenase, partial [Acidimicrobiales bacterium]
PNAPHRVLRSCVTAAEALDTDTVGQGNMGGQSMPIPRWAPPPPSRDTTGAVRAMALYAGQGVGSVREVRPAADVVAELASGAEP